MTRAELEAMHDLELDDLVNARIFHQDNDPGWSPNFSSDMDAAMKIVAKLDHDAWWWKMERRQETADRLRYTFELRKLEVEEYAQNDCLPRAICVAALLALGVAS